MALRLSLEFRASGRTDLQAFLVEHADLRDLIEPMISVGPQPPSGATSRDRFAPGTVIGGYRLEGLIGRGGMGAVFRARQAGLGRDVALKVLATPIGLVQEQALWRFRREATLLAGLDHPGLVKVFDAGIDAGIPYYAMELIDGAPLSAVLAAVRRAGLASADCGTVQAALAGALAEADGAFGTVARGPRGYVTVMADIAARVAEALAFAHAAGVIHRDVKPGNVLLRRDGRPLLADFGVARSEGAATLTLTGDLAGTLPYMSPEQARGQEIDHRSDVFSLGVLLYESLTLRLPFGGGDAGPVLEAFDRSAPRDPSLLNPAVPPDLAAVTLKALAEDKASRYQTAGDLAADLRAFLEGRPVTARHPSVGQRLRRWAAREPWRAAALCIAVAGAVGLGIVTAAFMQSLLREGRRTGAALAEVKRLAIGVRLEQAELSAKAFRIARSESIPAMEAWLAGEGEPLARELPGLRELLEFVRARALPYGETEAAADRASHPEAASLERLEQEAARLERIAEEPGDGDAAEDLRQRLAVLASERRSLRARISERRTWQFAEPETRFLHDQVMLLIGRLARFAESDRGALAHVRRQLAWARESRRRCFEEGAGAWEKAAAAVAADPRYRGLQLRPQADLLPLGVDPGSGLWEFVHLRSGAPGHEVPSRRDDGTIRPDDDMGIVFVLLPGGRFRMGAQADDPLGNNYDAEAGAYETPVHEIELAPFFLAKYETTQAQWRRLTDGDDPAYYKARWTGNPGPRLTLRNPVENVSQLRALEVMGDHGLKLPTEAQWEYACRAGTSTPFSFGDRDLAPRHANFADASATSFGIPWPCETDLTDGHIVHAPVGSFVANPFGLYDMHGNVGELTRDLAVEYTRPTRADDGEREPWFSDKPLIIQRGGAFNTPLVRQRASDRTLFHTPDYHSDTVGVRAARAVER